MPELKSKIDKEYGDTPMGKRIFVDLFRWLWFIDSRPLRS
jgi:hypothetical protein